MKFLKDLFDSNEKQLSKLRAVADKVMLFEDEVSKLTQDEFKAQTEQWKLELSKLSTEDKKSYLNSILPKAYAHVREASVRTLEKKHYYVQVVAGIALHQGKIAEQKTGEGKTLTATLPLYLNALTGNGVHLVTTNDYLATHHAAWMGPIFNYLGLSVSAIVQQETSFVFDPSFENEKFLDEVSKKLKPCSRREAYTADITYGTNSEFGFDYLRDNMARKVEDISQTNPNGLFGYHNYAIVDEVDSILIDMARTPLIISQPAEESNQKYYDIAKIVSPLQKDTDYEIDEKLNSAGLTEEGVKKVEKYLGVDNLYEKDFETVHHVENAIRAKALYMKDRDYVVKDGKVLIVDKFTGRVLMSNRWSEGLHQAIEAKEGLEIQRENRTLAQVSYQNYFRMYDKLAGMTGTAETEAEEFHKIYKLDVVVIPTNKSAIRQDLPDMVYKTEKGKYEAVADQVAELFKTGQPVLIGTTSVENSELVSELLKKRGVAHEVLNAKNNEREALIIASAGKQGAVTVSTNMAGRGVDILLGGDNPDDKSQDKVRKLGGLYVIGTERHESRRIDNQLRGRSGRQGDPGKSRFFVSLQDELMRVFGGSIVEGLMDRFGLDDDTPIESRMVSSAIENAQKRVEGYNFDRRKRVVEFDDVMDKQRDVVYKLRRKILGAEQGGFNKDWYLSKLQPYVEEDLLGMWEKYSAQISDAVWRSFVMALSLDVVDSLWVNHLEDMDDVMEGINLRGYAQKDPLVEYRKEAHQRFGVLVDTVYSTVANRLVSVVKAEEESLKAGQIKIDVSDAPGQIRYSAPQLETGVRNEAEESGPRGFKIEPVKSNQDKVGRNDPCPCGKTKSDGTPVKYKNCHGKGK